MDTSQKIIVVVGPTASGKSDFAVALAKKENGEIISSDSRQVYRGLDIGTGKITEEEMAGVPHHMIDIIDIHQSFSVADYEAIATPIIIDILKRGKTPIICGGTGQYIDALIYKNTFAKVPPNEVLRRELETKTNEELFLKLQEQDQARAEKIDKHNKVRLVRALEIIEQEGKVPVLQDAQFRYPTEIYLLSPSKEVLRTRIETRLRKRLDLGMLEEGRRLLTENFSTKKLASLGLEYIWMNHYLQGTYSYEEMESKLLTSIWHYAKRQMTWNKKYASLKETIIIPVKE